MREKDEEPGGVEKKIELEPIGVIHTPYKPGHFAPFQPLEREEGEARIKLFPEYVDGLRSLEKFNYIYVLYYMDKNEQEWTEEVRPPWAKGHSVGLFASRSPNRPNRIGLSIVRLRKLEEDTITTSAMDVFDHTPLLDLKPYIKGLDSKPGANYGWIEELDGHDHLMEHVRGIPHDHD